MIGPAWTSNDRASLGLEPRLADHHAGSMYRDATNGGGLPVRRTDLLFGGAPVPDMESGSLFHFPDHCGI